MAPGSVPGEAVVTGLVQHIDVRDNHVRNVSGRTVFALWYRYDAPARTYVLLRASSARSANGGSYRVSIADPAVAAVELSALRCDLSPDDANLDDCLHLPSGEVCQAWTTPVFVQISPNAQKQQHLKVPCAILP